MRVLHVTRGFADYMSGLVGGMATLDDVETYLALSRADIGMKETCPERVQTIATGAPSVRDLRNVFSVFRLAQVAKQIKPDIVHLQSGVLWELLLFNLLPGQSFVSTIHDIQRHPSRGKQKLFPQECLDHLSRRSSALIVHGESLKSFASEYYGDSEISRKIYSIPHGIIDRYGKSEGKLQPSPNGRILFFGTIDEWKGVEYLVAAESLLREWFPEIEIIVAGKCVDSPYYGGLMAGNKNIKFRPERQGDEQVRELFMWADIIALPYIEASQSGVLQLAFSFSMPPVVTSVGGLPDVINDGVNGLVVPPKSPDELAHAIRRLLTDMSLRETVIKNIRLGTQGEYSWGSIARKTRDMYLEVLDRDRRGYSS